MTREDEFRVGMRGLVEAYVAEGPDAPGESRGLLVEEFIMLGAVFANPDGKPADGVPLFVCLTLQALQAFYAERQLHSAP